MNNPCLTMNITKDSLKFFVLNGKYISESNNDMMFAINTKRIIADKYDFGIIINSSIYNKYLQNIGCPLYSPTEIFNYYQLIVNHQFTQIDGKLFEDRIKFIFVNLETICDRSNYTDFVSWYLTVIDDIDNYKNVFIVINELNVQDDIDSENMNDLDDTDHYVSNFLNLLLATVNKNTYVLSSDSEYFAHVSLYGKISCDESLNMILCGNIFDNFDCKYFLTNGTSYKFFNGYFVIHRSDNLSGFVGITKDSKNINIDYRYLNMLTVSQIVVHSVIRLLEGYKSSDKKNEVDLYLLRSYHSYIEQNGLILIYKNNLANKNIRSYFLKCKVIDDVMIELTNLLE